MKRIILGLITCSLLMVSCSKKGCTDSIAENYDAKAKTDDGSCAYILGCTDETSKNYNAEATKDDGTCEYYTNTELLTMEVWKYSSLSTTGSNEADMITFFTGATFNFKTDGTVAFSFPSEPAASETKTWEFASNETKILLDKGLDSEDTIDMPTLDTDNLTIKFTDDDTGALVTVNWIH